MTRNQLEHAIRAACNVTNDSELIVFGSQAILGTYPDAPLSLRTSLEVDIQPKNLPGNTDLIDGALGELSLFHQTHGFYVHGVSIESAKLPKGWENRTVKVSDPFGTQGFTGHCLEAHDLAASKLAAGREKDTFFVTTLMVEKLIRAEALSHRVNELPVPQLNRESLLDWIHITAEELGES